MCLSKRVLFGETPVRLMFYSGGQTSANEDLHDALSGMVGRKIKKSFTYVPYCAKGSKTFYMRAIKRYRRFGFSQFHCMPVDEFISKDSLERALSGDVIYLAGGNTYYFLYHLRRSGLMPKLRRFAKQGGIIAGLSAGGLILTPHIQLAGYPDFDSDENEVGLDKFEALNLVKFEFFPHFRNKKILVDALSKYSESSKYPMITCTDGSGIIIEPGRTQFIGNVTVFARGEKIIK